MAPSNKDPNRIVRTWAGPGTGDRYEQTADGYVWLTSYAPPSSVPVTGEVRGWSDGVRVRESK